MSEETGTPAAAKKQKRSGRHLARGEDGLFDCVGAELLDRAIKGEIGVRRPRQMRWLAKQIGLRFAKPVRGWRQRKTRPELVQAIALQALFPWIPMSAWLTPEERQMVLAAQTMGQILAAEPPPNPKTSRKKNKPDPRQVTLEEVIASRTPPAKPKPKAAAVVLDEPDLGDWDPSFEGAPAARSVEP